MGLTYATLGLSSGDDLALFMRGYIKESEIKKVTTRELIVKLIC